MRKLRTKEVKYLLQSYIINVFIKIGLAIRWEELILKSKWFIVLTVFVYSHSYYIPSTD